MSFRVGSALLMGFFIAVGADDSQAVGTEGLKPVRPKCAQATTLSFCLEDATYPSDDIQRDINANYGVFYQMYADVANQSTSSLVEGVPDDEDKYDYAFYFGEKRNLLSGSPAKDRPVYSNYVFRDDYYKDGGYICPAFIEYTSVFQATNARGEWQYIVNVKPWTQTVRLEQCFYPLAPCSYMSPSFKTQCVQKYSYQRLIAYEPHGRGLYTDIFRLPTACSCYMRPLRTGLPITMQSDASQNIASYNGPTTGYYPNSNLRPPPSDAISNGFKPVHVRNPPRDGMGYAPAASLNADSWYTNNDRSSPADSLMSASTRSDTSAQDSMLVERRRLRPDGLTLSDITSDPEVDLNSFGGSADGDFGQQPQPAGVNQGPLRPPRPSQSLPPRYGDGPYQQPAPNGRGRGPPSQFQGDESHFEPSFTSNGQGYTGMAGGESGALSAGNQDPHSGSRMWSGNGPPDFGPPGQGQQGPVSGQGSGDYRMSQGSGYYDYNSAQHN